MGCGGSTPEVEAESIDVDVTEEGMSQTDGAAISLSIAEAEAMKAKPNKSTFIGSVLLAKEKASENAEVLEQCCTRLQAYNRLVYEAAQGTRDLQGASGDSVAGIEASAEAQKKAAEANAAVSIENANASPTLVRSSVHERLPPLMPRAVAANEAIAGPAAAPAR